MYRCFIVSPNIYLSVTWPTWLFALDLLFAPFLFNFLAFNHESVTEDLMLWKKFMNTSSRDETKSWKAYFDDENAAYSTIGGWQKCNLIGRNLMWVVLPAGILVNKYVLLTAPGTDGSWKVPALVGFAIWLTTMRNSSFVTSRKYRRLLMLPLSPFPFSTVNLFCTALLYGRAGRLTAQTAERRGGEYLGKE